MRHFRQETPSHRFFGVVTLALGLYFASDVFAQPGVNLIVGQSESIQLEALADSVNLSRSGVVDVSKGSNKSELVFAGRSVGNVDVTVRLTNGKVIVYHASVNDPEGLARRVDRIRNVLGSLPGVSVTVQGNQIVLAGKVLSKAALQTIANLKNQNPGIIVDGTEKSLPEPNTIVQTINRILSENDIGNLQAMNYGKLIVLEGSPKEDSERELALKIARMISPDIEDRTSKKGNAAPSVTIDVMFVEASTRNSRQVGFGTAVIDEKTGKPKVSGNTIGGISTTGFGGSKGRLSWAVLPLTRMLEMVQSRGSSRVLANPQLVGRSGELAEFHSGGTVSFGYQAIQDKTVVTQLKEVPYGVILKVLPLCDKLGQIDVKLETNVADIVESNQRNAVVDVSESKLKTAVTVKDGQSILLSGLVAKRQQKLVEKVPVLGDIPILGELFKNRTQSEDEKELLILVTMNRISATDQTSDQAKRLWRSAAKDIEFSIFD